MSAANDKLQEGMTENPNTGLWMAVLGLPPGQQLAVAGITLLLLGSGYAAGRVITNSKVDKVEAEKVGLQSEISRLQHAPSTSPASAPTTSPDVGTPLLDDAHLDDRSLEEVRTLFARERNSLMDLAENDPKRDIYFKKTALQRGDENQVSLLLEELGLVGLRFNWTTTVGDVSAIWENGGKRYVTVIGLYAMDDIAVSYHFDADTNLARLKLLKKGDPISLTGVLNEFGQLARCKLIN